MVCLMTLKRSDRDRRDIMIPTMISYFTKEVEQDNVSHHYVPVIDLGLNYPESSRHTSNGTIIEPPVHYYLQGFLSNGMDKAEIPNHHVRGLTYEKFIVQLPSFCLAAFFFKRLAFLSEDSVF